MLEADFLRYYQLDLREAINDTPRRLWALIQGLPPDSATFRSDQPNWTQADELAATAVEVADAWGRQIVSTLVALKGGKVRLPEPVRIKHPDRPEPAAPEKKQITSDPNEIAAFFSQRIR